VAASPAAYSSVVPTTAAVRAVVSVISAPPCASILPASGQAGSPSVSAVRTMPCSASMDRYPEILSAWVSIHLRELVRAVAIS
jgi:hypothetical protein